MGITRWQPFSEMGPFRNVMDRFFEEPFSRQFRVLEPGSLMHGLPLDVYEESDKYVVEAGLPGFKPGDVDVQLQGNTLTITGRLGQSQEKDGERNYLVRERIGGQFTRSITLPLEIEADKAEANFENGVLRLSLPKTPSHQPRRIEIRADKGSQPGQIKGASESR